MNVGLYVGNPYSFSLILNDLIKDNKKVESYSGMSSGMIKKLPDKDIITVFTSTFSINKKLIDAIMKKGFIRRRFVFVCSYLQVNEMVKLIGWNLKETEK